MNIRKLAVAGRRLAPESSRRIKKIVLPLLRLGYGTLDLVSQPYEAPVFVLGHHKTGTTAIASLLAIAANSRVSHDIFNAREWYPLGDLFSGRLTFDEYVMKTRYHFSSPIIKEPDLTFIYASLVKHFPKASFVFVVRDPWENIRSILDRLGFSGKLDQLGESELQKLQKLSGWRMILDPEPLDIPSEQYIDVLAYRWLYSAQIYFSNKQNMRLVRYEDFIEDKNYTIDQLVKSLGLTKQREIGGMSDVAFQPPGGRRGEISEMFSCSNSARIARICGDEAHGLGYL